MRLFPTKRVWKRLVLGLAILIALALIANGVMVWRTESRLQAKIAEIRAAGDPATIADLAPDPVPVDKNAAAILEQLAPRLDEFAKDHVHFLDRTDLGKDYESRQRRGEPPTQEQIEAIQTIVDKYPDLDAGLDAAAACDQYASLADFSVDHLRLVENILNERANRIRTAARFTAWQVEILLRQGEFEPAIAKCIRTLQVARHYDNEPLLINNLVALAIRGVAAQMLYDTLVAGSISPELHQELDRELALHDDPQHLIQVLKTEQAYGVSAAAESGLVCQANVNPTWLRLVGWPVKSLYVESLGIYDDQLQLASQPWYSIRDRFEPDGRMRTSGHGVLGVLLAPALGAAYVANARNLAVMRALRILNAIAQYRDEHGRDASGLEDLSLPNEATIDPFSGEPLKLEHTPDGWVIYSVMRNGVDDGGDFKDQEDYGLAPRKWRAAAD